MRFADAWRRFLPHGVVLSDPAFSQRHTALAIILWLHLPVLLWLELGVQSLGVAIAIVSPVAVLAALALVRAAGRLPRMLATSVGLLISSGVVVHASGGATEAYFHYFLVIGMIALYQDWRPFLLAIMTILVHHGVVGFLLPDTVFGPGTEDPVRWAMVHGGFLLAVCAIQMAFWKLAESERATAEAYYRDLYEGERSLVRHLKAAEAVKSQLVAVVSHEFRTPLTSIQGYAATLSRQTGELNPQATRRAAAVIESEAQRLRDLVNSVLAASGDMAVDHHASTDLEGIIAGVLDAREGDLPGGVSIHVDVPRGLRARISAASATQVIGELIDNATKFAEPDTIVEVRGRPAVSRVVLEFINVADPIPPDVVSELFEPFTQGDSTDSRSVDGMGLGLSVVRRLVESHHGHVDMHHDGRRVVVRVDLPRTKGPIPARIDISEPNALTS